MRRDIVANILDYLEWRGDLTLDQSPFCPVDSLILCRAAYLPFDGILGDAPMTFSEAAQRYFKKGTPHLGRLLMEQDVSLFQALGESRRFGGMALSDYVNHLDPAEEEQFSAVTVALGNGIRYLAYRGTDSTLVGWKEDFNMTFLTPVPAQREGLDYLNYVARKRRGALMLGGHSKGGNLAVYAAAMAAPKVQGRILVVHNNDGPGFDAEMLRQPGYQAVLGRIHTFLPQSSVIGMLLEHEEPYTVVHSVQRGLLQHDLYSWEVNRSGFREMETITESSQFVDRTLKNWLAALAPIQRERFLDVLYEVLSATGATTLSELSASWLRSAGTILKGLKNVDADTRRMIWQTLIQLMQAARSSMPSIRMRRSPRQRKGLHD